VLRVVLEIVGVEPVAAELASPAEDEVAVVPDGELSDLSGRASLVLLVAGGMALMLGGPLLSSAMVKFS
jgi:hypothetical protein